jgi:hypothetical protein
MPEERPGLMDAFGPGDRGVGQVRLERGPDTFDGIVLRAVTGAVDQTQPPVGGGPPLHLRGVVDAVVVADHRNGRDGGVGGQQHLQHGNEARRAVAGEQVKPGAGGDIEGAEDGGPPVGARCHHAVAVSS